MNNRYPRIQARAPLGDINKGTLNKLTTDKQSALGNDPRRHYVITDPLGMQRISKESAQNTIDSDAIMQVLPDMEHVVQILVGTILNPKDMSQSDINILVRENAFSSEMTRGLLEVITEHFKFDYKMDDRLDKVLEQIIAGQGASIQVILPENSLDLIINGQRNLSLEDFDSLVKRLNEDRPLGLLGAGIRYDAKGKRIETREQVSVEHLTGKPLAQAQTVGFSDSGLTVTDNFNILKKPQHNKLRQSLSINAMLKRNTVSLEHGYEQSKGLTPEQIEQLYKRTEGRGQQTVVVERPEYIDKPSVGHPLVLDLPTSSVIPVFIPGKPYEHVGYFVLIDRYGRPLTWDTPTDYYGELRTNFNNKYGSTDNSSELLRVTKEALGAGDTRNAVEIEKLHQSYNSIVEADLKKRLLNGAYREEFDLGFSEEIQRIMFHRHLKNEQTQILYIPQELVVYIAFNYDHNGVGTSMLARSKILANMRSVLLFAETMAGVRNAVGRKKVSINLDPNDPDKHQTIADVQQLILESGRRGFPIGAPDPSHTLDYLNRAGYDFSINANAEDYHQMSVDYDDYNTNIQAGNPDLQDRLKKMHYSAMGCPPEKVDPENGSEFAVSIVQNDLLMARRVKSYQKIFCEGQTKFIQVYTRNSSVLVNRLLEVVKENRNAIPEGYSEESGMQFIEDFIDALEVRLPQPDTTRTEALMSQLEAHDALLTRVLENYLTPDLFPDDLMVKEGSMDKVIAVVKAHFMRQYIQENNILPEVGVLYEMESGKPVFSLFDSHEMAFESLGTVIQEFIAGMEQTKKEWSKRFVNQGGLGGGDDFGVGDTFDSEPTDGVDFGSDPFTDTEEESAFGEDPFTDSTTEEEEESEVEDTPETDGEEPQ